MNNNTHRKLIRLNAAAERLDLQAVHAQGLVSRTQAPDWVKCGRAVCCTEESLERFIDANLIPAQGRQ